MIIHPFRHSIIELVEYIKLDGVGSFVDAVQSEQTQGCNNTSQMYLEFVRCIGVVKLEKIATDKTFDDRNKCLSS